MISRNNNNNSKAESESTAFNGSSFGTSVPVSASLTKFSLNSRLITPVPKNSSVLHIYALASRLKTAESVPKGIGIRYSRYRTCKAVYVLAIYSTPTYLKSEGHLLIYN